jgi:N-acetylglutamate synthase-like GNAT family acetyltransferase
MLAVAPERREEGLGYLIIEAAMKKARSDGALHLYLVTDGKQGVIGEKMGFDIIARQNIAPGIAATMEYQMARSKTSSWLRKEL